MKIKRHNDKIPFVNLIPMLDVMMAVLSFFIFTSMTLGGGLEGVDVQLPSGDGDRTAQEGADVSNKSLFMLVKVNPDGVPLVEDKPISKEQLLAQTKFYLSQNPKGVVVVLALTNTPYEQVIQTLSALRQVGGARVSLAIEPEEKATPNPDSSQP